MFSPGPVELLILAVIGMFFLGVFVGFPLLLVLYISKRRDVNRNLFPCPDCAPCLIAGD